MPKRVDHQERRTELVDAMLQLTVRDGIAAVSIRNVAAEAGCSTRPVQYYFASKADLLAAGHARVSERAAERIRRAVQKLGDDPSPRAIVDAIVRSFFPTNRQAREDLILYYAFYAAELTDANLRIPRARNVPNTLARVIAEQIRRHHGDGLPPDLDPDKEARLLVVAIAPLASGVVAGYHKLADAKTLIDHALDRLLPA